MRRIHRELLAGVDGRRIGDVVTISNLLDLAIQQGRREMATGSKRSRRRVRRERRTVTDKAVLAAMHLSGYVKVKTYEDWLVRRRRVDVDGQLTIQFEGEQDAGN